LFFFRVLSLNIAATFTFVFDSQFTELLPAAVDYCIVIVCSFVHVIAANKLMMMMMMFLDTSGILRKD